MRQAANRNAKGASNSAQANAGRQITKGDGNYMN